MHLKGVPTLEKTIYVAVQNPDVGKMDLSKIRTQCIFFMLVLIFVTKDRPIERHFHWIN